MSLYSGIEFYQIAEQHSEAVAKLEALRQGQAQEGHGDALATARTRESDLRAALVELKPRSNHEAQMKLLYLAQYLFATTGSLSDEEMAVITNSIAHLRVK